METTQSKVLLQFIDDGDVEEMTVRLSKLSRLKRDGSHGKSGGKTNTPSVLLRHEEAQDGHEEVLDFMNVELPEECMEPTTKVLSEELLNNDAESHFGFQTPKKKQGMTLKAQQSANKYHGTPNKTETPSKSRSRKTDDQQTPVKTPQNKSMPVSTARRSNRISFGGEIGRTPSTGLMLTPTKSNLKSRRSILEEPSTPTSVHMKVNGQYTRRNTIRRITSNDALKALTPTRRRSMATIEETNASIPKTPHRERLRNRALIKKVNESASADDSDSEASLEYSSDDQDDYKPQDEESSEEESEIDDKGNSESDDEKFQSPVRKRTFTLIARKDQTAVTPSRSRRGEVNYDITTDAYFETMASKDVTSNNTLSRLRNPRLREDTLRDLLKDTDADHKEPLKKLTEDHQALFTRWLFALSEGFNILLYGLGSKRHLLQALHDEVLGDSQVLLVNGFFPGLTMKEILDTILTGLLGVAAKDTPANPLEAVDAITKIQSSPDADTLYLLIHNLDGPSLKNNKAQTVLSKLANIPNVRLIASIDHINAALMWDQTKLWRYKFCWWDVTTFMPYSVETSFETSLLIQRSGALQLSALHNVFKSLNDNSKKIYMMIAKHQLENASSDTYKGLPLQDLYWMAREAFAVSTLPILRQILREFEDHDMVKVKRGAAELLTIPILNTLIQQFVQAQEEKAD